MWLHAYVVLPVQAHLQIYMHVHLHIHASRVSLTRTCACCAGGSAGGHSASTARSNLQPGNLMHVKQQQRVARNDTDESAGGGRNSLRPGAAPSKGGTSVSSGTGIFVDGATTNEGAWRSRFYALVSAHLGQHAHMQK